MAETSTGYFVFSLDTELATGLFDMDERRARTFSPDGSRERLMIRRLLDLMDEYDIHTTWAIVGHLFYRQCEYCPICPVKDWQGRYKSYDEAYGTANPLWYGEDVVDEIIRRGRHEIGYHGYTHRIFNENTMPEDQARVEINEWLRVAARKGITPKSIVFPRDLAGYLPLFAESGFTNYRIEEPMSIWIRNKYFGRYVKTADHLLAVSTPPLFTLNDIKKDTSGLFALPESMHIKAFNLRLERKLDNAGLPLLRLRRAVNGIHKAAHRNRIIHLWAHPWEFQTDQDIDKVRYIFEAVAEEQQRGRMRSITMNELTKLAAENR